MTAAEQPHPQPSPAREVLDLELPDPDPAGAEPGPFPDPPHHARRVEPGPVGRVPGEVVGGKARGEQGKPK